MHGLIDARRHATKTLNVPIIDMLPQFVLKTKQVHNLHACARTYSLSNEYASSKGLMLSSHVKQSFQDLFSISEKLVLSLGMSS